MVAESADRMNARVLTHQTFAPARPAASGLSPVAISVRPNGKRISQKLPTVTATRMTTE